MIRMQQSHIRFGTFERLHALDRKDLIAILLDHVIEVYYPHLWGKDDRYALFYAELVQRVATLTAQWMSTGFCHAVLNTDNMAITGESFDYGPFAFIPTLDPSFTAAYFDHFGRYSYGRQPAICRWNLEMLQRPLERVISSSDLESGLAPFNTHYEQTYRQRMLHKLGFEASDNPALEELLNLTLTLLKETQIGYHSFFAELAQQFSQDWRNDVGQIFSEASVSLGEFANLWNTWKNSYFSLLLSLPEAEMDAIATRLRLHNPTTTPLRPAIETVWDAIAQQDDWQPFNVLLKEIQAA